MFRNGIGDCLLFALQVSVNKNILMTYTDLQLLQIVERERQCIFITAPSVKQHGMHGKSRANLKLPCTGFVAERPVGLLHS